MASPRFEWLLEICDFPLPEGMCRFHYFMREKTAYAFAAACEQKCDIRKLDGGATFLKPIAYPIFEYLGNVYEGRFEFPYETPIDDCREAFLDADKMGCDCSASDIINRCTEGGFKILPCGHTIGLIRVSFMVDTNLDEFETH